MILIFFIYGLAFFVLGVAIFLYPRKNSSFGLAKDLELIAAFGVIHGLSEWIEMFTMLTPPGGSIIPRNLGWAFLSLSYFFLLLFGVKVLCGPTNRMPGLKALPPVLLFFCVALPLAFPRLGCRGDIWVRFLLGLPGTVLTGLALLSQLPVFRQVRLPSVARNIRIAAISFFVYAALSLFGRCETNAFPAVLFSSHAFLAMTGVPIQLLRAICAIIVTSSFIGVLRVFDWETREALVQAQSALELRVAERTSALVAANAALQNEIVLHKQTETALRQSEKALLAHQQQMRHLTSELSIAETTERRRIATLLHDQVGQAQSVMKMRLGMLTQMLFGTEHKDVLEEIRTLLEQAITETRSLTSELCSPILCELGLEAALEWLAEQFQAKNNIPCHFTDDEQKKPLDENLAVMLFWFVRELLANIVKHAKAKQVTIAISKQAAVNAIVITVTDDGIGMDDSKFDCFANRECGFGLFNIRERLDYLGGHLQIESTPGSGTSMTMIVPFQGSDFDTRGDRR